MDSFRHCRLGTPPQIPLNNKYLTSIDTDYELQDQNHRPLLCLIASRRQSRGKSIGGSASYNSFRVSCACESDETFVARENASDVIPTTQLHLEGRIVHQC
jgi:hypothetical protein